jgi:hypothetical protein
VSYSPGSGWAVGPTVGTVGWSLTASGASCSPVTTTTHTNRQTSQATTPTGQSISSYKSPELPPRHAPNSTASRTQEDKSKYDQLWNREGGIAPT